MNYEPVSQKHQQTIISIHEKLLDSGEGTRKYLNSVFSQRDPTGFVCIDKNEVAGYFLAESGISFTVSQPKLAEKLRKDTVNETVYTVSSLAVRDEYRRTGISEELFALTLEEIRKKGGSRLLFEMWVHGDGHIPAIGFLKGLNKYTEYGYYSDFYKDAIEQQICCSICNGHCRCGAKIYLFNI